MKGKIDIDLFATRSNTQCQTYFAYKPDPTALAIDAFLQTWNFKTMYAFPPFSVIGRLIQRVEEEQLEVLAVLPRWPTQFWFGRASPIDRPSKNAAQLQGISLSPQDTARDHPFHSKLRLTLFHLSGQPLKPEEFRAGLPPSSRMHGDPPPNCSMRTMLNNGCNFVVDNRLITCLPL